MERIGFLLCGINAKTWCCHVLGNVPNCKLVNAKGTGCRWCHRNITFCFVRGLLLLSPNKKRSRGWQRVVCYILLYQQKATIISMLSCHGTPNVWQLWRQAETFTLDNRLILVAFQCTFISYWQLILVRFSSNIKFVQPISTAAAVL